MTKPDPLSPEALAAVAEVRKARADIENRLGDWCVTDTQCPETREHLDWPEAFDRYLLAVRDATLKAERERLLALTPEEVVEAAERAGIATGCSCGQSPCQFPRQLRAALPVLLAPEIAKREAAEWNAVKSAERQTAAEAERDRMRAALEELARPKRSPIDHEHALQCIAAIRRRARAALGGSNG